MLSDPIRLVSREFRGHGNTSGSLTCFVALPKLFLQGSVLSLCRRLLIRGMVLLPYCMAVRGDWSAETFRQVSKLKKMDVVNLYIYGSINRINRVNSINIIYRSTVSYVQLVYNNWLYTVQFGLQDCLEFGMGRDWCHLVICMGGQCWEGVQHPDSLVDEAVSQSADSHLEAPQSPPGGFSVSYRRARGWRNSGWDGWNHPHVLEGGVPMILSAALTMRCRVFPAGCSAAAVPHSDAAGQDALSGSTVEGIHDGDWCWAFLASDAMLLPQERSSVRCTPRNLVLLTLSTASPFMVSGGWWVGALRKSTTNSFVFSTLRERLLSLHHAASLLTLSL